MRRTFLKLLGVALIGGSMPAFAADENGATYGSGKNRF